MRRALRPVALLLIAVFAFVSCGCATFDWLMDAERRKNEWLRETFFGAPRQSQTNLPLVGNGYDFGSPCNGAPASSANSVPPSVILMPPASSSETGQ